MDFVILNVNGKDLSKATHEEAVEAFKNAQEPIIVQVMRRSPCNAKNGGTTPGGGGPGVGPGGIPGPVPVERSAVCSVGTQTELQSEDLLWKVLQRCSLPPSEKHCDGTLEGLCELDAEDPLSVLDSDLLQKLEAMEGNLDLPILDEEDCLDRAYEMEYEDIVLKRTNVEDKLGLTLCYGSEEDSGIFISEIDPNSIAYDDARLKEGDQILQINGEDVLNKDQALSLFSLQMECTSLLVCRPQLRFEDCLYEGNALLDDLQMDMLEQTHQEAMQFTACLLHNSEGRPDEDATTDTGTTNTSNHLEKDSGVGRATDESTRNDESSDHELLVDDGSSVHQKFAVDTASMGSGGDLRYSNESFTSNSTAEHDFMGQEISVEECRKFQVALENKCDNKHLRSDTDESTRGKETKVMRLGSDSMDTTSQSGDSLNRPCRNRLICDHDELEKEKRINGHDIWLSNHSQDDQLDTIPCQCPGSGSQKVDKPEKDTSHDRPAELSIDGKQEANKENGVPGERLHRRSGSGSGRSHRAPRTVPGSPGGRSKSSSSSRDRSKSTSSSGSTKGSSKDRKNSPCKTAPVNTAEHDQQQAHQQQQQQQYHQDQLGQLPGATPYPRRPATNPHLRSQISQRSPYFMQHDTTRTNLLKHNWKVQQQTTQLRKSFDRYGSIQSLQSVPAYAKHYRSYLHLVNQNEENAMKNTSNARKNVEGQWKVKIRSDGTRYITKRSSRDRLLKERATKIQEERAGMTTDDEAISEMKLGRYWSKEDRKEHLARARDQRLRREYMQQARMECLQELEEDGILSGGGGKREPDIVELSHRKLLKKKGRKMMLDDFTTVQEMLIHGSKVSPDTAKEFSPFLNVTMV